MEEQLVQKSKWFWVWQDDREEAWLGEMAMQGLHLQRVGLFGRYTFVKDSPRAVAYRMDFITESKKKPDYIQLFQDAGWEHVGEMGGWQYWRKDFGEGKAVEIFTDNTSKTQKYQRLLGFLVIFLSVYILLLTRYDESIASQYAGHAGTLYEVFFFLFFVICMFYLFTIVMIIRRISSLKKG